MCYYLNVHFKGQRVKAKSSNASLHMLMVCIRNYLKSVLRYKFVILDAYHPETPREQGCEDPWLFFEDKSGPRAKVSETLMYRHEAGDFLNTLYTFELVCKTSGSSKRKLHTKDQSIS